MSRAKQRKARTTPSPVLWPYLVGLAILIGFLSWAVGCGGWMAGDEFREALVTLGLQVLVFGLAGGGIKLLLDEAAARREFRTEMLRRLGRAHRQVYRIRRLLSRVEELRAPREASQWDRAEAETARLLGELMDVRQDLGGVWHEVRPWTRSDERRQIQLLVKGMRDYLEEVIEAAHEPDGDAKRTPYTRFLQYREERGDYVDRFKTPYNRAKELVDPVSVNRDTAP